VCSPFVRLFKKSATYSPPVLSTATAAGPLNELADTAPLGKFATPLVKLPPCPYTTVAASPFGGQNSTPAKHSTQERAQQKQQQERREDREREGRCSLSACLQSSPRLSPTSCSPCLVSALLCLLLSFLLYVRWLFGSGIKNPPLTSSAIRFTLPKLLAVGRTPVTDPDCKSAELAVRLPP
jgi:hypothetical protein